MHYFKKNIGDYAKKAGRLSMLQHGAYTLLMDTCYDREQFPTRDEAIEWTWASTTPEIEAVEFVLRKFFVLEGDRYVQKRIQEEITEYHDRAANNKRIADEREQKRRDSLTGRARTVHEAPPNHKPLTTNHKPVEDQKRLRKSAKTPPPSDFAISPAVQAWATEKGFTRLPERLEDFMGKCAANGYTYVDWDAALMSAIRNDWAKFGEKSSINGKVSIHEQRREVTAALTGRSSAIPSINGEVNRVG